MSDKKMLSWSNFIKGKMGPYMKSEGSHGGAMKRLAKEWKMYKTGFIVDFKNVKTIKPKKSKKRVVKKPTTKKPSTKKPSTKKPSTKKPSTKKPTTKKPSTKKPTELRALRNQKIRYDVRLSFLVTNAERDKINKYINKKRMTVSQLFRSKIFPL